MIHPVILCGGSGTRLWPLSRKDRPKQFTRVLDGATLFEATVARLQGPGFAPPVVVSNSDFRFLAAEQLHDAGAVDAALLLEPAPRNTAPAILCAALHLQDGGAGAEVMLVAPSDHVIADADAFARAVATGAEAARGGALVTFGIRPDRPETGYGYLELSDPAATAAGRAVPVQRFVEKPAAQAAREMLATGRFLWNAGIFMFTPDAVVAAFAAHAPAMLEPCRAAVDTAQADLDFMRLGAEAFAAVAADSIDYAVMEKAADVMAVPVECGWSDLGAWDAVWHQMDRDAEGVAARGAVNAMACRDSLLRSETDGPRVVGVGLDRIAVVAMRDAVLVADMDSLQSVKAAVAALKACGAPEAETLPRTYRPWGWYETVARADRFQVKQIMVPPGKKLSLQSHVHRAEHWIVVAGTAQVTVDGDVRLVAENESVYVPLGAVHRLENPGKVNLHLIEVQTGAYLGEDDIIRYEDIYNRI